MKPQLLVIEAGHHDGWLGTTGAKGNGIDERNYCRELAIALEAILVDKLEDVPVQTVGVETSMTLFEKELFVRTYVLENNLDPKQCFSISLHLNSWKSSEPSGTELYYKGRNKKAKNMGEFIIEAFQKYDMFPLRNQFLNSADGTRSDYINDFWANSVLLESAFLSNPQDAKTLKENRARLAQCIAHGLLNYFRQ